MTDKILTPEQVADLRATNSSFDEVTSSEEIDELLASHQLLQTDRDRLVERESTLRKRIHFLEKHNQFFERCESGWCNPSNSSDPASEGHGDTVNGEHASIQLDRDRLQEKCDRLEAVMSNAPHARNCLPPARTGQKRASRRGCAI
jgi:hypothetical protein